jgi:hypothetical protein
MIKVDVKIKSDKHLGMEGVLCIIYLLLYSWTNRLYVLMWYCQLSVYSSDT